MWFNGITILMKVNEDWGCQAAEMQINGPFNSYVALKSNMVPFMRVICMNQWYMQGKIFCEYWLNGIVHPNMKILSLLTHPQVVPNLYAFLSSAEHKRRYLEECGQPNSFWSPLTFIVSKSTGSSNYLVASTLQNILFYVQQKKETHTGFENCHFWVNYFFKFWFTQYITLLYGFWRLGIQYVTLDHKTSHK